jgi:enoyl-CoA hydratase/carnithine racemase
MVALSRNLSAKHAMEMLLLGDMVDAESAARMGLVNRVVPPGAALDAALAMAQRIAAKPGHTLAIGKEAFYAQLELGLADAYDHAAQVMVENMLHRDSVEGIGAFIDKREPVWAERDA